MKKLFLTLSCFAIGLIASAQWSDDATIADTKVCTASTQQFHSYSVSDGSGGAIIAWQNFPPNGPDISYNHLNAAGVVTWAPVTTGLSLISGTEYYYIDQLLADGSGGAFIVWETENKTTTDITELSVQHISSTGSRLWTSTGVVVTPSGFSGFMCLDGSGGIVVTWSDDEFDPVDYNLRAFAQRINSSGTKMWNPDGVRVVTTTAFESSVGIIPDGSGGAIIAFTDTRNSNYNPVANAFDNIDLYAQHLNATGIAVWGADGVPVCTAAKNQIKYSDGHSDGEHPAIVSDGAGGAILAWEDYRTDPNNGNTDPYLGDIYAQRINSAGATQWTSTGVLVCNAPFDQTRSTVIGDGAGGAVIIWEDLRLQYSSELYTQKLNSAGTPMWGANGKLLANPESEAQFTACADETGNNVLVSWLKYENPFKDIAVQKIVIADGSYLWGSGTLVISRLPDQAEPAITHNGAGGAIVSWTDYRNGISDIYANRVVASGTLPVRILNFDAQYVTRAIALTWRTSFEQNSKTFTVQRSTDGANFQTITALPAAGNSTVLRLYKYNDEAALRLPNKTLYYRVFETDIDGKQIFTDVKTVKLPALKNQLALKFNPVNTHAVLTYTALANNLAMIRITDLSGKIVLQQKVQVNSGENEFLLQTANLSKGIYQVELLSSQEHQLVKMIKQ